MARPSGNLIIAGQVFTTNAPIVTWRDGGFDASLQGCVGTACGPGGAPVIVSAPNVSPRRIRERPQLRTPVTVREVQQVIRQVVIHHGATDRADIAFRVLHDEHGLSVHFIVDDDGTIYQTCDIAMMALHAGALNSTSIGIMLCNRGDAAKEPDYYARKGKQRPVKRVRIHGQDILAYDFSTEQMESMASLGRALRRLLPNVAPTYPQAAPGEPRWDAMPEIEARRFSGFLGHYHLSQRHWDPGPFDFKGFVKRVAHEVSITAARQWYGFDDTKRGEYFPVGPWGSSRLWHGGVHLDGNAVDPERASDKRVIAPFPGIVVAARMGEPSPIGSTNFVLMRHDLAYGAAPIRFYSLFMHLADERAARQRPMWFADGKLPTDRVALLDRVVDAGEVIGHIGTAGPPGMSRPQMHFEIFSTVELFSGDAAWKVIDGSRSGRFCDDARITGPIDRDRDGGLSTEELAAASATGTLRDLERYVTLHVSEWTSSPSWSEALRVPRDFRGMPASEIDELVTDQITPTLWWTDEVAAHCELPRDGVVYHYHPLRFLEFLARPNDRTQVEPGRRLELSATTLHEDLTAGTDMLASDCLPLELEEIVLGADAPACIRRR